METYHSLASLHGTAEALQLGVGCFLSWSDQHRACTVLANVGMSSNWESAILFRVVLGVRVSVPKVPNRTVLNSSYGTSRAKIVPSGRGDMMNKQHAYSVKSLGGWQSRGVDVSGKVRSRSGHFQASLRGGRVQQPSGTSNCLPRCRLPRPRPLLLHPIKIAIACRYVLYLFDSVRVWNGTAEDLRKNKRTKPKSRKGGDKGRGRDKPSCGRGRMARIRKNRWLPVPYCTAQCLSPITSRIEGTRLATTFGGLDRHYLPFL
ncbi:hypothetical protein B0T26DRAFT_361670 [Lasiosphaeria miniovina]|uniref:Uncharacterized protein n=1 Tax=Lasiosphaeria miniovina TaxID=1954250 RepID=A0AA40ACL3_9PEZI|nr:uncharacterized protein B0T26DRAFT_361670 [Lasiosphaeria miniovina]KAK0713305.1 hypothetical protein B0T26DRAFT_361670 [Lasiosphaeria miniovina]